MVFPSESFEGMKWCNLLEDRKEEQQKLFIAGGRWKPLK